MARPTPTSGPLLAWLLTAALISPCASCKLGRDYTGDETGLTRLEYGIPGHDEWKISYLIQENPTEPRVIIIHGSPGQSGMYVDYLRNPVEGVETIAVDRMGYGQSEPHRAIVSFETQAATLSPLLEERRGHWPILVGHSLGAPIAARMAVDYPDRVGALVFVAGSVNPELEDITWYQTVANFPLIKPFLAEFLQIATDEAYACKEQVALLDAELGKIQCPVIVLHGTADGLVPFESLDYTLQRFEDHGKVFVQVLIGEGHSLTKKRALEVREVIEAVRDAMRTNQDGDLRQELWSDDMEDA